MGSEGRVKCSGVVFGSCNNNFTRYRKYRYWDSKVRICQIQGFATFVTLGRIYFAISLYETPHFFASRPEKIPGEK